MIDQPILLEPQYAGSLSFWKLILQHEKIVFEQYENYTKRSFRNRCHIVSPNGILRLSIPLEHGKNQHCALKEVRISYNERWQNLHWQSLQTCYRRSPYFEFYEDKLVPFYEKRIDFLLDFNLQLFDTICNILKTKPEYMLTTSYDDTVENTYSDFRNVLLPNIVQPQYETKSYLQVFCDRMPFQQNVSILDLLFNCGNQALTYLKD